MKQTRRFVVVALVLFAAAAGSLFAGGQGEKSTSTQAQAQTQALPAINVLINSSPWLDSFRALVALYQKDTGNQVNLDVTPFPGMLQKSRNATSAATSEYDLINLNEEWYLQFYKGGLVTPLKQIDPNFKLDPQIIEYNYADRWDPKVNGSTKAGEIYGLPINGNIQILYYRKDLFEQKGLAPPKTFSDLLADAKIFNDPPKMYGFTARTSDDPIFNLLAFVHGFGGSIVTLDQQSGKWSVNLAKKPAVDALKFWLNLAWNYDPQNYTQIDQAAMISLMASGRSAMAIMVDAAAPNFDNPKVSTVIGKIGAVVTPGLTTELRSPTSGIWIMGIPHNLPMERKKAALAFLTWAMTQKAEQAYADAGGIVVREDVYQAMAKDAKFWWAGAVADSTPYIKPFPRVTSSGEIHTMLNDMLKQVVAKQLDPDTMMKQAADKIQSIMEAAGYPMVPLSN
ncbi:MAG TPA: extracellular solute-binding protein [Spirochaetia bacterium]|nr:extracellular solute-binding protein [Spirochaetia bacterium]